MVPQWIIEKKRDGQTLTGDEITWFIRGYTDETIPDYQMAALAMAIYFRGMSPAETASLTSAMMNTGDVLNLETINAPTCDKHSTGGIGDKVSLVLAPLAASCGIAVPMISGRGLGITGGTLDKLESIPGYNTRLSPAEFERVISQCGCSIIGQTDNLAPADRKLYALRDVTGTVPSIPLISASIMSKKLAEGAKHLVLDIKYGSGAFMKDMASARLLAETMITIGNSMGRHIAALVTDMNQPLGCTAGNALEVLESVDTLEGHGPQDIVEITVSLCAEMLVLCGLTSTLPEAAKLARLNLANGSALSVFRRMVSLHGGDPGVLDNRSLLPVARHSRIIKSRSSGFIANMDADSVGRAALVLGAGRRTVADAIDYSAGVSGIAKIGQQVERNEPVMILHSNSMTALDEAERLADSAYTVTDGSPDTPTLIYERITEEGIR